MRPHCMQKGIFAPSSDAGALKRRIACSGLEVGQRHGLRALGVSAELRAELGVIVMRRCAHTRADRHSAQPEHDCGEVEEGEVVDGPSVVAGREASTVLELVEAALDAVAVLVGRLVLRALTPRPSSRALSAGSAMMRRAARRARRHFGRRHRHSQQRRGWRPQPYGLGRKRRRIVASVRRLVRCGDFLELCGVRPCRLADCRSLHRRWRGRRFPWAARRQDSGARASLARRLFAGVILIVAAYVGWRAANG